MANPITPRIGRFTRALIVTETTPGVDPGSPVGYIAQSRDKWTYAAKQATSPAAAFKGNIRPDDRTYDNIDASGGAPMWLDYDTAPVLFIAPFGTSGYSKVTLAGGFYLHRISAPSGLATPRSLQIQYEDLQTTAVYTRLRNTLVKDLKIGYPMKGAIPLDCSLVGSGDEVYTDIAGTKTDNALSVSNVFNGKAIVNGYQLTSLKDFTVMLNFGAIVEAVGMNAGIGIPIVDNINTNVTMKLLQGVGGLGPEGDLNLLTLGVNQNPIALDCVWANLPIASATRWLRLKQPNNIISRMGNTSGGKGGKIVEASMDMVDRSATIAGEAFGTTLGPFTITGSTNDVFSVKPDGGTTINVTLTAGSRTTDQIVTQLNADSTFNVKLVADNFNGRVRVTSLQTGGTGSSSSVQFIQATSHACGDTLGFTDGIVTTAPVIPGFNSPILIEFFNKQSVTY